jgi:hypothetical protein
MAYFPWAQLGVNQLSVCEASLACCQEHVVDVNLWGAHLIRGDERVVGEDFEGAPSDARRILGVDVTSRLARLERGGNGERK